MIEIIRGEDFTFIARYDNVIDLVFVCKALGIDRYLTDNKTMFIDGNTTNSFAVGKYDYEIIDIGNNVTRHKGTLTVTDNLYQNDIDNE